MAYLQPLYRNCNRAGCHTRAVVEVYASDQVRVGYFCAGHGHEVVEELTQQGF